MKAELHAIFGGINDYASGGGGYANERPCIDGLEGIKGGGEHNSRVG